MSFGVGTWMNFHFWENYVLNNFLQKDNCYFKIIAGLLYKIEKYQTQ